MLTPEDEGSVFPVVDARNHDRCADVEAKLIGGAAVGSLDPVSIVAPAVGIERWVAEKLE